MFFGVNMEGISDALPSAADAEAYLNRWSEHENFVLEYPFPVVALVFSMTDDKGYFAWKIEPGKGRLDRPVLLKHKRLTCHRATKAGLDTIVDRVRTWYELFYKTSLQPAGVP